jgi:hypothetical protein
MARKKATPAASSVADAMIGPRFRDTPVTLGVSTRPATLDIEDVATAEIVPVA